MKQAGYENYQEVGAREEMLRGLDGEYPKGAGRDCRKERKEDEICQLCIYDRPGFVPGVKR